MLQLQAHLKGGEGGAVMGAPENRGRPIYSDTASYYNPYYGVYWCEQVVV